MHVLAFYRNISFKGHTFRVAKYKGLFDNDKNKICNEYSFLPIEVIQLPIDLVCLTTKLLSYVQHQTMSM